ncbi:MAG: hypothetical protein P8X74_15260 [Reinekea sp.]
MPVTHGIEFTRIQVWLYTWIWLASSLVPVALEAMAGIYAVIALVLGARFLQWSYRLLRGKQVEAAWQTFKFSIRYLLCLFLALLLSLPVAIDNLLNLSFRHKCSYEPDYY